MKSTESITTNAARDAGSFHVGQLVEIEGRGLAELRKYLGAGMWQAEIETESVHKFGTFEESRFTAVATPSLTTNAKDLLAQAENLEKHASRRGYSGVEDRAKAQQLREQAAKLITNASAATAQYNGYTAQLSTDPSYYGSSVTQEQADQINARLGLAIRTQFPGIEVNEISIIGGNSGTLGENQEICDEVDEWIANNWTAAL